MKDSVLVNGVALTRSQIEQAMNELNQPDRPSHRERHGRIRRSVGNADYLLLDAERVKRQIEKFDSLGRPYMLRVGVNGSIYATYDVDYHLFNEHKLAGFKVDYSDSGKA